MIHVRIRFEEGIRHPADGITHRAWPKQRQHDIWPTSQPPGTQRLAEVLIVLVQPHTGGNVEETEHAECGIEEDATGVDAGIADLALQQVIGQNTLPITLSPRCSPETKQVDAGRPLTLALRQAWRS